MLKAWLWICSLVSKSKPFPDASLDLTDAFHLPENESSEYNGALKEPNHGKIRRR
jgi:hypothetical protein